MDTIVPIALVGSSSSIIVSTLVNYLPEWYLAIHDAYYYSNYTEIIKQQDEYRFYQLMFAMNSLIAKNSKYQNYNKTTIVLPFEENQEIRRYCLTMFAPGTRIHLNDYCITIQILGDTYGNVHGFRFRHYKQPNIQDGFEKFLINLGSTVYVGSELTVLPTARMQQLINEKNKI